MCGGGGGGVKYENLERLYEIQARQAEGLMDQANQNVYPAYNQLLEEAKNTGTIANQEAAAGRAAAEAMASGTAAKQKTAADLASMGVNPNDQRWANTNAAIDLDTTARSAAAQSGARSYVRDLGFAKTTDLVNSGMGIGSNAVAALNSAGGMASNIGNLQMQQQANRDANLGNIAALGTRLFMNTGGLVPKKYSEGDGLPLMRPLPTPGPVTKAAALASKGTLDPIDLRDGAGEGNGSGDGFDGGLLGMLGMDQGGQSVGNNGGMGLGSAQGGPGVSMGSAAGNAGDNSAETGADAAADGGPGGGPGGGGGAGSADADGFGGGGIGGGSAGADGNAHADGGLVRKYARGGRVPMVGGIKGYARGGIIGAMQAINPAPPPPGTRTASPMARAGQQVVAGGAKGAGTLVENVGNLVGKIAPEAGNSISSFGAGLRLGDKAQPAIEAYKAAATGAEAAGTAAAGAEAAGAAAAGAEAAGTVAAGAEAAGAAAAGAEAAGVAAAGAEAAGATATAMGAGSAIGSVLGAAMPWVGAAMLIGSAFDLFADGGEVKSHKIGGRQGRDGVAENETGGKVEGPGGPKEDKVMARLSPEEFVMPVATVKLFGLERLEKMRQLGLRHEKQLGIR